MGISVFKIIELEGEKENIEIIQNLRKHMKAKNLINKKCIRNSEYPKLLVFQEEKFLIKYLWQDKQYQEI